MGALGRSQGRRFSLFAPTLRLALHHGIELTTCPARDATRKSNIERQFSSIVSGWIEEV
jgi:hypothetical protein